ncbi:hypothetical protein J003_05350 [Cryptococcus neoformans]|nr:hypothetical protein J003_05350 [Cryptococcus neoformans var. grubii]
MPPRRYPLNTSAQAPTASQYSKTLQSRTPAKRPLQQASNTTQRGAGEDVGHDKRIERGDDYDSLDGIEESDADTEEQELDGIESDDLESEEDVEESQRRRKAIKTNHPSSLITRRTEEVNHDRNPPRDGRRSGDGLHPAAGAERGSNSSRQPSQETRSTSARTRPRGDPFNASAVSTYDSADTPLQTRGQTSSRDQRPPNEITRDLVSDQSRPSSRSTTHTCKDLPESPIDTNIEEIYDILKTNQPATLVYYNDALSLAGQVLAPLRAFLDIVLACHEPTDEVEGISASVRKRSNDNTLYGAVAAYIHHHAIEAKHMDVSIIRQSFPQILSSANLCDEDNVALRLDHHTFDKEAHGGFKTEVPASLNAPLNERMSFIGDKAGYMASKLDAQDGQSLAWNMSDLPACLPSFLFSWPPQGDGDRASFLRSELVAQALKVLNLGPAALKKDSRYGAPTTAQKSKATASSIPTIMYAASIVHFVLSTAPKIDNVDITVHDTVYHSGIFFFRSLEDVDQQAIIGFYDEHARDDQTERDARASSMWQDLWQWRRSQQRRGGSNGGGCNDM